MPSASLAQLRTSSGRCMSAVATWPPPQSWPRRSTGPSRRSSSPISQSRYAVTVAGKPAGSGTPKPGGESRTTSSTPARVSSATSGSHSAALSGLPCTNATVMAPHPALLAWMRRRRGATGSDQTPWSTAPAGALRADGVAEPLGVGELLVARHLPVFHRPDVNEAGVDRPVGASAGVVALREHALLVEGDDLVGLGRETLYVGEDRAEHVGEDLVPAVVHAAIGHAGALVPLDVLGHRIEDGIDVSASERLVYR